MLRLACIARVNRVPSATPCTSADESQTITGKKWYTVRGNRPLNISTLREKKSMVDARAIKGCMYNRTSTLFFGLLVMKLMKGSMVLTSKSVSVLG